MWIGYIKFFLAIEIFFWQAHPGEMRFLLFFVPIYLCCVDGNNNIIAQTYGKLTLTPQGDNVTVALNPQLGNQSTDFENFGALPLLEIANQSIDETLEKVKDKGHLDIPIKFSYQPNPALPGGFKVVVAILIQRIEVDLLSKNFNNAIWYTLGADSGSIITSIPVANGTFEPRINLNAQFLYEKKEKKKKTMVPLSYWHFLPNGYLLTKNYKNESYVVGKDNTEDKASQTFYIRIPYEQILYGRLTQTTLGATQYQTAYITRNLKQISDLLPVEVGYWFSITMYLNEIADNEDNARTSQTLEINTVNAQITSIDQYLKENFSEDQNAILKNNRKHLEEKKKEIEKAQEKE